MMRDQVLKAVSENRDRIRSEFSVRSLFLFGSAARGDDNDASDIDLLVEYEEGHPTGLFEFIRLLNYLEDLLGCKVDLVMPEALPAEFRERVRKEAIRAA